MQVKPKSKGKPDRAIPLKDIIGEEAAEAEREAMGGDMAFDPDRDLGMHGPRAFQASARDKDQMVIDELLASLPKNQGYYLKLYREIMPGKFELKERIDQYDTWTDMEYEVMERVKAMTRKFGAAKWGSALYRVVVWRNGGIRESNKYPVTDIIVDAGDTVDAAANIHHGRQDPAEAANEQMNALGNMLKAVETIMPRAVDPNIQFQAIVQAFTAGKGEQQNGSNQMMTLMMTMMTSMMTGMMEVMKGGGRPANGPPEQAFEERMAVMMNMMKSFGLGQTPLPKGLGEQLAELKLLGLDPFKKEDTIEQIAKLKALTGSLMDVMPNGNQPVERPGIFEKLIDAVAPHVPKIFSDIRAITDNAALAQKLQMTRQAAQPQPIAMENRPTTRAGTPIGPQPNRMGANDAFESPPDMDPYSGFTTRPFQRPTEEVASTDVEMFGSVEGGNAAERKAHATGQPIPQQSPMRKQPVPVDPRLPQGAIVAGESAIPAELPIFLQQIHGLIMENVTDAYAPLYDTLSTSAESVEMIKGIQQGVLNGSILTDELRKTGFPQMTDAVFIAKAQPYLDGFVAWILENTIKKVEAVCQECVSTHVFENAFEFHRSEKVCGGEKELGQPCQGILVLKGVRNVAALATV